jgi:hypothetical protein
MHMLLRRKSPGLRISARPQLRSRQTVNRYCSRLPAVMRVFPEELEP